jgi:hypothetical protein
MASVSTRLSGRTRCRWNLAVADLHISDGGLRINVKDYCGIDPIFGTLGDFDRLPAAVHGKG